MSSRYETSSEDIVPAIRSMMAKALVEGYRLKEAEVASYLDVTQAAISKYVHTKSKRIESKVKEIERGLGGNREQIEEYIKRIAEGEKEYAGVCICTICKRSKKADFACSFSCARP